MILLCQNLSGREADDYSLVLSAAGIPFYLSKRKDGWCLSVKDTDAVKAEKEIRQYLVEDQSFTVSLETHPEHENEQRSFAGLWLSIVLLGWHLAVSNTPNREALIHAYGSSAAHIMQGQLYRSVTGLMLHADAVHILANTVAMAFLGSAVCTLMGWGAGVLAVLVTGAVGNLLNAALYSHGHVSIGASTAVFGTIGILSGCQFFNKIRQPNQKLKAFLPIAGGMALLALLGSDAHSDIMAHLFGFLSGLIVGFFYSLRVPRKAPTRYQVGFFLATIGIVAAAWLKAF